MSSTSYPVRVWRGLQTTSTGRLLRLWALLTLAAIGAGASILQIADRGGHPLLFVVAGIVGAAAAVHQVAVPLSVSIRLPYGRSRVKVQVGDIWHIEGHRVIAVNEFFDSSLGDRVAPASLHGQVIERCFGGDELAFATAVDESLRSAGVTGRPVKGERPRFPIGTVAPVRYGRWWIVLTALARTNVATHKARASIDDLWAALEGAWSSARDKANGQRVLAPLIGEGQSQVPLSTRALLQLMLISIGAASREREISKEIVVVLSPECFAEINLRDVTLP